jgi:hypothetical protein
MSESQHNVMGKGKEHREATNRTMTVLSLSSSEASEEVQALAGLAAKE